MPKDKLKGRGPTVGLAKAATRTPLPAIQTALSAGFGGAIIPGLLPGQWRLAGREQQPLPPKKSGRRGK
jgi:hypothetical protein